MNDIDRILKAEGIGFHQSWFPIALVDEVRAEKPLGVDILGTRFVAYRDPAGTAVVQSAWCPHLGADLSQGEMIEGQIRCPYHHWRFAPSGACVHIPTGDKIPPGARTFAFPTAESWGLVWAFNGREPLFAPPQIPGVTEADLVIETRATGIVPRANWLGTSNGVDFQHLRTLHALPTTTPDRIEAGDYALEYRVETERYMQHGRITGTNVFAQHLRREGRDSFMLFAGAPIDRQTTRRFVVLGVPRGSANGADQQRIAAHFRGLRTMVDTLIAEDDPVLNTMRFKVGTLVASDRHLARFFKYVAEFPRFEAPE